MSRLSLFAVLSIIIFTGSVLFFQNDLVGIYPGLLSRSSPTETQVDEQITNLPQETEEQTLAPPSLTETQADGQAADLIQEIEEQISTPLPLIEIPPIETQADEQIVEEQTLTPLSLEAEEEEPLYSLLTQSGVIYWTNIQREQYGLPSLRENPKLNASAQEKMQDMFEEQYFAHISPSGVEAKDLAKIFGYEFITVGENLALGNFQNDQILVQAWMDSPGHRANILGAKYQEIGVAVGRGTFNGQSTWLAVQHFVLPFSACSQPDKTLLARIEENQTQTKELLAALTALRTEIQAIRPRRGPAYNQNIEIYRQKVEEYNILVSQYNTLIEETKDLVNQYNGQVQIFNECAS